MKKYAWHVIIYDKVSTGAESLCYEVPWNVMTVASVLAFMVNFINLHNVDEGMVMART